MPLAIPRAALLKYEGAEGVRPAHAVRFWRERAPSVLAVLQIVAAGGETCALVTRDGPERCR